MKNNNYTKRARIFVGMACNAKCRFCYYYLSKSHNFWTKAKIIKQINIAKTAGMEGIDFSGGEPTLHPDIIELITYAKSKGFKVVCTLTNGLKMADKKFVEKMVNAGINDVLFSVHGHNPKEHDYITQVPGSFKKIIQSISNFKKYDVPFRINCTVSKINYKNLEKHAKLYKRLNPRQVNFILFNDFELAEDLTDEFAVKYSEASPHIKKAIDILKKNTPYINVRYIPFCFMKGYEKYVTNYPQKIFDPFEWSQRMLLRFPANNITPQWKYFGHLFYGFLRTHPHKVRLSKDYIEDICVAMRMKHYVKSYACNKCKLSSICQGLEKSYIKVFHDDELNAAKGKKIEEPLFFRKDFYKGYTYGK